MDETALGYQAKVHQSLIQPVMFWGAPYEGAMVNAMTTFAFMFGLRMWAWALVGIIVHIALWLLARDDPQVVEIWRRYMRYRKYYYV